jgi:hypothetical protein
VLKSAEAIEAVSTLLKSPIAAIRLFMNPVLPLSDVEASSPGSPWRRPALPSEKVHEPPENPPDQG